MFLIIIVPFSYFNTGVSKLLLHSGADQGFTERRTIATLSIESLKQGVWGVQALMQKLWGSYLIFFSTKIPCNLPPADTA